MPKYSTKFQSGARAYIQPIVRSERAFQGTQPLTRRKLYVPEFKMPKKPTRTTGPTGTTGQQFTDEDKGRD